MVGDRDDMLARLKSLLPAGWFSQVDALRDAVIGGIGDALAWVYVFAAYARNQTRIATATGFWLDLIAWDFFGPRFLRRKGELDLSFKPRILQEILRPRQTRAAIIRVVTDLTGKAPDLFEPWNTGDCGAYGVGTMAYGGGGGVAAQIGGYGAPISGYGVGGFAYLVPTAVGEAFTGAGCYGSLEYPNQIFITVHRGAVLFPDVEGCGAYGAPTFAYGGGQDGIPMISGYGGPLGGYGVPGGLAYLNPHPPYGAFPGSGFYGTSATTGNLTDAEIYARIAETTAAGVVPWTAIN